MNDYDMGLMPKDVNLDRGIGSEFWLPSSDFDDEPLNQISNFYPDGEKVFVTSGREAIYLIIKSLNLSKNESILIPAYLCWSILDPFIRASCNYKFYKLNRNLEIEIEDIYKKIDENTKAILIIHYFGFPQSFKYLRDLKNKLIIIEDTTQSVFSQQQNKPTGSIGDISFASFRKIAPIPDSAFISYNNKEIKIPSVSEQDIHHINYKRIKDLALYSRGAYIKTGDNYLKKQSQIYFENAEELIQKLYNNPCRMSEASDELLKRLKVEQIVKQRRKNFKQLLNHNYKDLSPLFTTLLEGVCPVGFPILSERRDDLKQYLINKKIYPPIHWRLPESINKIDFTISWEISNKILTIPIDQRYNEKHMDYIISVLNEFN